MLVPGDMGRASFVCVGAKRPGDAEDAVDGLYPFHSACHGAGRALSRRAAIRRGAGRSIVAELKKRGIVVMAKDSRTLAEEMPEAYKDAAEVVEHARTSAAEHFDAFLAACAIAAGGVKDR